YPEATWSLTRPARIELGPDRFAISGLALAAGSQRVEVDVAHGPPPARHGGAVETRGKIAVTALDLARLPRALLPLVQRPGGRVEAEVECGGGAGAPESETGASGEGGGSDASRT